MMKTCFLNRERMCTAACAAFLEKPTGSSDCRLLAFLDRLIPPSSSRPTVPTPPPKVKT